MSWSSINNAQLPGWTAVLLPVTVEETAVFGGSNFGSVAFASSITAVYAVAATTVWSDVDDTYSPGWTPTNT